MSDQSQGPGWWIASNGKWYPPELHPDYVVPPPPQPTQEIPPPPQPGPPPQPVPTNPSKSGERSLAVRTWGRLWAWPIWARVLIALLLVAVIVAPFISEDDPEPVESAAESSERTTTTRRPSPRSTISTRPPRFELEDFAQELDVLAQAACLGMSTGRSDADDAVATIHNVITGYREEGATEEDMEAADLFVLGQIANHCTQDQLLDWGRARQRAGLGP